ncbi:YsnF/AvaK domain-containing protein [Dyadobacter sediminis]|nr:YsnF/AvaK domain-containing protein [Dyadobacter sediminis]GGC16333.1 hypothetical protein GCM10011325_48880 [Dyadobacter sediminis]
MLVTECLKTGQAKYANRLLKKNQFLKGKITIEDITIAQKEFIQYIKSTIRHNYLNTPGNQLTKNLKREIMSNTVIGIFEYESDAQQAQNNLLANGFADADVDIETASYTSEAGKTSGSNHNEDLADRIGNFFRDLFDGDEEETKRYSEAGKRGTIVTVHAASANEAEAAAAILDQYGAVDVNESAAGYSPNQTYAEALPNASSVSDDTTASLPIIEEKLQVGKRQVQTGGVRLRSRIVSRPVQEGIRLRQEQVTVDRTPVDRIASDSDFDTFKEGTFQVKEYAEVPVVSKEARVVEEVSLNKTVEEHDELINETVRKTEVDVEDLTEQERLRKSGSGL